jgi:hypothetical protein
VLSVGAFFAIATGIATRALADGGTATGSTRQGALTPGAAQAPWTWTAIPGGATIPEPPTTSTHAS